jgi:hypothetical protein
VRASMPLGVLIFWLGMCVAVRRFPSEYDWRYMTISMLLYPERNPAGHLWASIGLAVCGLCGLLWAVILIRDGTRNIGILVVGYACMVSSSLLPERLIPIPRGHEILAITAFVCICAGLVRYAFQRGRAIIVAAIPLGPILLATITQFYLDIFRPELPWVGLVWRTRGLPLFLSFALWEWITCAVLSFYMAALGWAVTRGGPRNLIPADP